MSVSCECCVLTGRGLCVGLITRPEESCRVWCVSECDREASIMTRPWPTGGCCTVGGKKINAARFACYIMSTEVPKASRVQTHADGSVTVQKQGKPPAKSSPPTIHLCRGGEEEKSPVLTGDSNTVKRH
jgi:hypothetical protein